MVFSRDSGSPTAPAPVACQRGFQGNRLWPAWASTKPKPCSPLEPRPPIQGGSAQEHEQGSGTGTEGPRWQPDPPQPWWWSQREASPPREAPHPGRPAQDRLTQVLTVGDVPETLGVQQVPQPGHLVLQLADQLVVGVLVDDRVAADLLGPVGIPGQQKERRAVRMLRRPEGWGSQRAGPGGIARAAGQRPTGGVTRPQLTR